MITKRNIARGMMATGSLVYLLGIWRTCPLFSGKGYFLGVLVMGMFAVLAHQRASQWQEQDDGFIALCRLDPRRPGDAKNGISAAPRRVKGKK